MAGQHIPFRRQPANISRRPSFHTGPHNPKPANSLPPGLAGRRLIFLPTTFLTSTKHHLPTKYRSLPFFHTSSFFYFLYRRHPPGFRLSVPPTPISSHHFPNSLHFFRPAAASPTSRPNAKRSFARGCSLQGCRWCGRGARVSFFLLSLFLFFPIFFPISLAPRLRRDAFIFLFIFVFFFLFAFVLIFVFLFVFFAFIFAFFFLLFSLYFSSDFLFLFFFVLSFYFFFFFAFAFIFVFFIFFLFVFSFFYFCFFSLCLSFCSLFIFAFIFVFCLSFCFTFLPSSLQSLSSLSNRSPAIRFFSPAANLSHPLQSLPGSSKKEKNIGKRIHGGRMASRERTGGGRKDRGTGLNELREKDMYITREEIREKKKWAPPGAGWFPGRNFAERRALPPKAAGRERKCGRKGEKCICFICLFFPLFLCIFTNTKKDNSFVHIFMYIQKRKKCICKVTYRKQSWRYACICLCMYFKKVQWLV